MRWHGFVFRLLAVFLGGCVALLALLALLDPWGMLPFASPLPRYPADHSQRWAYPELARDGQFDSAIIGNSTARLLDPRALDPAAEARFVNLAMVHAFAYEQAQLLDVFLRAHPTPRAVLVGLDQVWCQRGDDGERFGYGPLPEFLYRGDRIAALSHLLNLHAIDTAWRSLHAVLGLAPRPYGQNGWTLLDVDSHPYDPALAKALIAEHLAQLWPGPPTADPASWHYAALEWLTARLDAMPASTRKLLVFVPHHYLFPAPGSVGAAMIDECKRRVVALARERPNTAVYDFSIPSPMTVDETKWWDAVHLRPEPMAAVSQELADAIKGRPSADVQVLTPAPLAASLSAP